QRGPVFRRELARGGIGAVEQGRREGGRQDRVSLVRGTRRKGGVIVVCVFAAWRVLDVGSGGDAVAAPAQGGQQAAHLGVGEGVRDGLEQHGAGRGGVGALVPQDRLQVERQGGEVVVVHLGEDVVAERVVLKLGGRGVPERGDIAGGGVSAVGVLREDQVER